MIFKVPVYEKEFDRAPLLLRIMVEDADQYCLAHYGKHLTVTRVLDHVQGESGVHTDYRAVDCRNRYCGLWTFNLDQVQELLKYINEKYWRKDGYSSLVHHTFNSGPEHFHFQIASDTKAYMRN